MPTSRDDRGALTIEVTEGRPRQFLRFDAEDIHELWILMGGEALEDKLERILKRLEAVEERQGTARRRGER